MSYLLFRIWGADLVVVLVAIGAFMLWLLVHPRQRKLDPGEAPPDDPEPVNKVRVWFGRVFGIVAILGLLFTIFNHTVARRVLTARILQSGLPGTAEVLGSKGRTGAEKPSSVGYLIEIRTPQGSRRVRVDWDHVLGLESRQTLDWRGELPVKYLPGHPDAFVVTRAPPPS